MDKIIMRYPDLKIEKGLIKLSLTPKQCKQIAAGLYLASEHGPSDDHDTWSTLAMCFQASGEAGELQRDSGWHKKENGNGHPIVHIENGDIIGGQNGT